MKKESLIELDYTPDLNRKIINKVGVPGDNLPDNLMQFMCKHYENDTIIIGKRILVIRMLDLAKQYAVKNTVTYFTDNKEKYDEFLKVINNGEKFGGDDEVEFVDDWTKLGEVLKDMPKFDVIIGNPPYTRGGKDTRPLYIEILNSIIDKTDKLIWLCPSQWVFGYNIKGKIINTFKEKYELTDCEHITNPFDDAAMANVIGIYYFDLNTQNKLKYTDIFFNQFNNPKLVKSIEQKFKKISSHLCDYTNKENDYKYYVNAALIRGHIDQATGKKKWDWTTLFGEDQRTIFDKKLKNRNIFWKFKTLNECKNFVNAHETDILEFAQLIEKSNSNICLCLTPYLNDYTHEWTEEAIAKELNLTQEEVDYIHEEMKNFGWKAQPKK